MSYPYWQRCAELLDIIHLVFSGAIRSQYSVDFVDGMTTALSEGEMVSSLNLVRSWLIPNVSGRSRQSTSGLLRYCEATDMQVSRLADTEQCHPWDQLLKRGLADTYVHCDRMLAGGVSFVEFIPVDGDRSSVCAQLES